MRKVARALGAAGTCLMLGMVGPMSSAQAEPGPAGIVVRISTVPSLAGVRFSLDGRRFMSGRDGTARILVSRPGRYDLQILDRILHRPGVVARFIRWRDESFSQTRVVVLRSDRPKNLQVGFDMTYRIRPAFVDQRGAVIDPARIDAVTLSSGGGRIRLDPTAEPWLPGSRVVRKVDGLHSVPIPHAIIEVRSAGSNVVFEGQQRFYATPNARWTVRVLFYNLNIAVRDRLFGFTVGSSITLKYPDGHAEDFALSRGAKIVLASLPRGEYQVIVRGPGLSFAAPIALSRDEVSHLMFLSFYDVAATGAAGLLFLIGLVFLGRRRVQAKSARRTRPLTSGPTETTLTRAASR